MGTKVIEENLKTIRIPKEHDPEFIYSILLAYGKPKSSISRLRSGSYNLSKSPDEILWKNTIFFKYTKGQELHFTIDELRHREDIKRHNPRFIVITDYKQLLAVDSKTEETLDIPIAELSKHYGFFLPLAGMEKKGIEIENIADVRAAERMAKLYDEIIKCNEKNTLEFYHSLNVFFARLLFCFFAEDTEVFNKGQFTSSIASYTQESGSDLHEFLDELFKALDLENKSSYPSHIQAFPYVNGGLFNKPLPSPLFNKTARQILLQCGELDWSQINPDIFGSMIQAVVHPGQRASLGMHYTSVENIMKVINPLFLEDLHSEFKKGFEDVKKLKKLLQRMYSIKVLDPACGSGNFLIIAYKELRKLEHAILQRITVLEHGRVALFNLSGVKLENFYGIEIDDFAHEIAILSLWLAKHQMNIEFKQLFGIEISLIPLKDTGNVVCDNAATVDWTIVFPISAEDEAYLIGNPPYLGSSMQDATQKKELALNCKGFKNYKNLDYISIWFIKASQFISEKNAKSAFVSTNSICQGEQVALLWPYIFSLNIEIHFAHTSFKWTNHARHIAGVTCIIVGLANKSDKQKRLYSENVVKTVDNINPYLVEGKNIIIPRRTLPLSNIPEMIYGNKATDDGNLILSKDERDKLEIDDPRAKKFIKKYIGSEDLMKGYVRYCLWINDKDLDETLSIIGIKQRLEAVSVFRKKSIAASTSDYAKFPNRFKQRTYREEKSIIIPRVTSERREYIPIDYLDENTVVADSSFAMYDADPYVFGLISSKMHMAWVKAVAGRLKTDIRYSSALAYNNFPVPELNEKQKQMIANNVFEVLDVREKYSEKTLSELYDPRKMPDDLKVAHKSLDEIVEHCYRSKPFESDEERLAYLFKLYEIMSKEKED